MGLFKRKPKEPVVHADVDRRIHVRADEAAVRAQLGGYDEIMGRRAEPRAYGIHAADGWTTLVLPPRVHPWAHHNLAMWLMDTSVPVDGPAEVIVTAGTGDGHHGYWLMADPDGGDQLCGHRADGQPITVRVPDNAWVIGDEVPVPAATVGQALAGAGVPADALSAQPSATVDVRTEDPQHDLNPSVESSFPTRKRMRESMRGFDVL